MKVFIVVESGYYNEEYWDIHSEIDSVFLTREKAEAYVKSIDGVFFDEESELYKVGDEDEDPYSVRFYEIEEHEVEGES